MRTVPTFGRQTDVLYGVDSYAISGGKDVFVYGSKEATAIEDLWARHGFLGTRCTHAKCKQCLQLKTELVSPKLERRSAKLGCSLPKREQLADKAEDGKVVSNSEGAPLLRSEKCALELAEVRTSLC